MASVFSAIRAQMLADADDPTAVSVAMEGPIAEGEYPTTKPCAVLLWGDADYRYIDLGNQRERVRVLTIEIYGDTREEVDLAIEELQDLWDGSSYRNALLALGCIDVTPETDSPSFMYDGSTHVHWGVIQFNVTYRTAT
jgi:hypothetical protein